MSALVSPLQPQPQVQQLQLFPLQPQLQPQPSRQLQPVVPPQLLLLQPPQVLQLQLQIRLSIFNINADAANVAYGSQTSLAVTGNSNTANDTLVLIAQEFGNGTNGVGTVTDSQGDTWTNIYADTGDYIQYFISNSIGAGANTVTFNAGSAVPYGILVSLSEYSGGPLYFANAATEASATSNNVATNPLTSLYSPALYLATFKPSSGGETFLTPTCNAMSYAGSANGFSI